MTICDAIIFVAGSCFGAAVAIAVLVHYFTKDD
jgi:hypothetical protein